MRAVKALLLASVLAAAATATLVQQQLKTPVGAAPAPTPLPWSMPMPAAAAKCDTKMYPTVTVTCSDLGDNWNNCFFPNPPSTTDVVVFPAGKYVWNLTFADDYMPLMVKGIVIDAGASLELLNTGGLSASDCIHVAGHLKLQGDFEYYGSTPPEYETWQLAGHDAGTADCRWSLNGGFAPRICGTGPVRVGNGGVLNITGFRATVWSEVLINEGGLFDIGNAGSVFGNIYSNGTLEATSRGTYYAPSQVFIGGGVYSSSVAAIRNAQCFTIAPVNGTCLLYNYGLMTLLGSVPYRVEIYNFATLNITIDYGMTAYVQSIFNLGQVWAYQSEQFQWMQGTSFLYVTVTFNAGTFYADAVYVNLETSQSEGGTYITVHQGQFYFGNGAGEDPMAAVPCDHDARVELLSKASAGGSGQTCNGTSGNLDSGCPTGECCFLGNCIPNKCGNEAGDYVCCPLQCFTYMWSGYCGVYTGSLDAATGLETVQHHAAEGTSGTCQHDLMTARFGDARVQRLTEEIVRLGKNRDERRKHHRDDGASTPRLATLKPTASRYSFFGASVIGGDGTGSVELNSAAALRGTITVARGGVLHSAVEHRSTPFVGGGQIVVERGGKFVAGLSATFTNGFSVDVREGASFFIPKHAAVALTNATVSVARGAFFQIDGLFTVGDAAPRPVGGRVDTLLTLCAPLRGQGAFVSDVEPTRRVGETGECQTYF